METDKVFVPESEIELMGQHGQLLAVNRLYGWTYATPRRPIESALCEARFPVLDFPISSLPMIECALGLAVHCVYVAPPCLNVLRHRLADGRDPSEMRLRAAVLELEMFRKGQYRGWIDVQVVSHVGSEVRNARVAQLSYMRAVGTAA